MVVQNSVLEMEAIPIPVYTGASGLSVAPQDVLELAPVLPRFALGNELQRGFLELGGAIPFPESPQGPELARGHLPDPHGRGRGRQGPRSGRLSGACGS